MKKLLVVFSMIMSLCLVGCGNKEVSDSGKSPDGKFIFTIVDGVLAKTDEGVEVLNVTMKMDNNSECSASPIDSMCGVWGFQNGQDMPLKYDANLQKADNYTAVLNGSTLEYNVLLETTDKSAVTVEVKDKKNNKLIAKKVIELE